jgi:hypothetical protein
MYVTGSDLKVSAYCGLFDFALLGTAYVGNGMHASFEAELSVSTTELYSISPVFDAVLIGRAILFLATEHCRCKQYNIAQRHIKLPSTALAAITVVDFLLAASSAVGALSMLMVPTATWVAAGVDEIELTAVLVVLVIVPVVMVAVVSVVADVVDVSLVLVLEVVAVTVVLVAEVMVVAVVVLDTEVDETVVLVSVTVVEVIVVLDTETVVELRVVLE